MFSDCILVKGAARSLICDIQRGTYAFIENDIYDLIGELEKCSIEEIKSNFPQSEHLIIENFLAYLNANDFGFYTSHPERFPILNLEWKSPSPITNSIIDINKVDRHYLSIPKQLNQLGCKAVQIRCFAMLGLHFMEELLSKTKDTKIESVQIIYPVGGFDLQQIEELIDNHERLVSIVLFGASEDKNLGSYRKCSVIEIAENLIDMSCCGKINKSFFALNIDLFTESQHHNTCLNRKISIDAEGNIKNCPSMPQSFGNIKDTTLQEALDHPDFKKYWNINKDKIHVCKDCEFRHICTDCRAYVEDPEDILSKPLKCGYNPYTGVWEEWSTNPLKQKAIEFYGMQDLVKEDTRR